MPRNAIRLALIALHLAACAVDPEGVDDPEDVDDDDDERAAGCFCRLESLRNWRPAGADAPACGGDGAPSCPDAFTCIDDPTDDCDPHDDGIVGCSGICGVPCGGPGDLPCSGPREACVDIPDDCDPYARDPGCSGYCAPIAGTACE